MRKTVSLALLTLAGCATSLNDIRGREVQDDVVAPKPLRQIRDCLVTTLAIMRNPSETGDDNRRELVFSTPAAGAIFHYILTAVPTGTRVEARRKNSIADGFNAARKCYQT